MARVSLGSAIEKFKEKKVLVLGDVMLDQYSFGEISRISPEAPVPVVLRKSDKFVLGGAANVANNLASLGAKVFLIGVVGKDHRKDILSRLLREKGIDTSGMVISSNRPTTLKNRIMAGEFHQVIRFDDESTDNLTEKEEKSVILFVSKNIKGFDILVLSDYVKGFFSSSLTKKIIKLAKRNEKKIIADIKPKNKDIFLGVDLIAPNLEEAQEITGKKELKDAGLALVKMFTANVFVTLGGDGIAVFEKNGKFLKSPVKKVKVYDVSGAGDTVTAVMALSFACGISLENMAKLANIAGSIVVQKPGTATISYEELHSDILQNISYDEDVSIVPKVWGYEKWLENNDRYCCKLLVINKGYQCSLHYHKMKDEMFYVSKGHVRLESDGKISHMREGYFARIKPGTKHRFRGIEDSVVIEVSTHHEESDSYRIEVARKVEDEEK